VAGRLRSIASIIEDGDGYMLQVEMPGVTKDGLEISVENNELTIIGHRSLATAEGTLIHRESRRENYRRAFELDPSIDADKISAKIDQGVVTLTLSKAEQVKPRKIKVS
jgi:HSP20 family protein